MSQTSVMADPVVDVQIDNRGQWLTIPLLCPVCLNRITGITTTVPIDDERPCFTEHRIRPRPRRPATEPCDHVVTVTIRNVGDCW